MGTSVDLPPSLVPLPGYPVLSWSLHKIQNIIRTNCFDVFKTVNYCLHFTGLTLANAASETTGKARRGNSISEAILSLDSPNDLSQQTSSGRSR